MSSLNSILLVIDHAEAALPALQRAVLLAAENQARLTILNIAPAWSFGIRRSSFESQLAEQRLHRMLNRLTRKLRAGHELRFIAEQREVDAIEQALQLANEADLIVLGDAQSCSLRSLLFGTKAERILRLSRRPVLVVKRPPSAPSTHSAPYRRTLVPIDLTEATTRAVGWAARIAPRSTLHLLHAVSVPMAGRLRMADCTDESMQSTLQRAKTTSLHRLWSLAATLQVQRTLSTVAEGRPAALTLQRSRQTAADLIVVGKSGRSLIGDFLLGSTAQQLLSEADTDLLIIPKPARTRGESGSANGLQGRQLNA